MINNINNKGGNNRFHIGDRTNISIGSPSLPIGAIADVDTLVQLRSQQQEDLKDKKRPTRLRVGVYFIVGLVLLLPSLYFFMQLTGDMWVGGFEGFSSLRELSERSDGGKLVGVVLTFLLGMLGVTFEVSSIGILIIRPQEDKEAVRKLKREIRSIDRRLEELSKE